MNNDFVDIIKVLTISDGKKTGRKQAEELLKCICEKSQDGAFCDLRNEYHMSKGLMVEALEKVCDNTVYICREKKCSKCAIRKWCGHYRNKAQTDELTRTGLTYVDFFCGAGGLSVGFKQEGFRLALANDIQKCCIETYSFNHPETPLSHMVAGDINEVIKNVRELTRFQDIDVVVGGPPCQGFSMANRQRLIDDPRNHLYKSYISAVDILQPKVVVMENVRGILNVENQIREDFLKIGYAVSARLLNAKDFGVPQNRERVIFIGNRIGLDNEELFNYLYGYANRQPRTVLSDAILGLPVLSAKTKINHTEDEDKKTGFNITKNAATSISDYVSRINDGGDCGILYNHKARYNNARDIEIFGRLLPGDNSTDPKIQDIMPYKRREKIFKDKYFKLEFDRPCKTITAHMKYDCNMYIHPSQARGLTPREAARIQSYPDDYYFRGAYTTTYMQVGNSVPPLLSRGIAQTIKHFLEEE